MMDDFSQKLHHTVCDSFSLPVSDRATTSKTEQQRSYANVWLTSDRGLVAAICSKTTEPDGTSALMWRGIQRWVNVDSCKTTCFSVPSEALTFDDACSSLCFLPPLKLSPLQEDVSRAQERKQTCQRGECLHSATEQRAPCPPQR